MIRSEVILWVTGILVIIFAFVLMPAHERFVDAQGRQTDVSPDAPPKPDWLKAVDERTGKREQMIDMVGPGRSHVNLIQSPSAPAPVISSTLGVGDPSLSGMDASLGSDSGVRRAQGSPWIGAAGQNTEMASTPTNPIFYMNPRPALPTGQLPSGTPSPALYGPGPTLPRSALQGCTCASQTGSCGVHQ
jgi:hypothetical protein